MAYKPGHFTEDWIPYDTMIPKKCSDAHTLFRTIVYAEDFCKKHSWEEQMRIKEEECRPLFTDYLDVFEKENPKYQHIYPCRMPKWPCRDPRESSLTQLQKKLLDCDYLKQHLITQAGTNGFCLQEDILTLKNGAWQKKFDRVENCEMDWPCDSHGMNAVPSILVLLLTIFFIWK